MVRAALNINRTPSRTVRRLCDREKLYTVVEIVRINLDYKMFSQTVCPNSQRLKEVNTVVICWISTICLRVKRFPKNVVDFMFSIHGSIKTPYWLNYKMPYSWGLGKYFFAASKNINKNEISITYGYFNKNVKIFSK